jgi:predicted P-loop ATPase
MTRSNDETVIQEFNNVTSPEPVPVPATTDLPSESADISPAALGAAMTGLAAANSAGNAIKVVRAVARAGMLRVRLNLFTHQVMMKWGNNQARALQDADVTRLLTAIQLADVAWHKLRKDALRDGLEEAARQDSFDPVVDYLERLTPARQLDEGGLDVFDRLVVEGLVVPEAARKYAADAIRNHFVAAVTRQFRPGAQYKIMVVLDGPQDAGKSTAIETMSIPGTFVDVVGLNFESKDFLSLLNSGVFVEISELAALNKSSLEAVKAIISRHRDRYRRPYARIEEDVDRRSVMWGTTNDGKYLIDTTGNVRFLPIKVERADLEWISGKRDEMWAAAMFCYGGDHPWPYWVAPEGADGNREARRVVDPWEDILRKVIDEGGCEVRDGTSTRREPFPTGWVATQDILERFLLVPRERQHPSMGRRVADVMRRNGYESKQGGARGKVAGWEPAAPAAPAADDGGVE